MAWVYDSMIGGRIVNSGWDSKLQVQHLVIVVKFGGVDGGRRRALEILMWTGIIHSRRQRK